MTDTCNKFAGLVACDTMKMKFLLETDELNTIIMPMSWAVLCQQVCQFWNCSTKHFRLLFNFFIAFTSSPL